MSSTLPSLRALVGCALLTLTLALLHGTTRFVVHPDRIVDQADASGAVSARKSWSLPPWLVAGGWLLVAGCWLLLAGCDLLCVSSIGMSIHDTGTLKVLPGRSSAQQPTSNRCYSPRRSRASWRLLDHGDSVVRCARLAAVVHVMAHETGALNHPSGRGSVSVCQWFNAKLQNTPSVSGNPITPIVRVLLRRQTI